MVSAEQRTQFAHMPSICTVERSSGDSALSAAAMD
jgi:hypothetical protein